MTTEMEFLRRVAARQPASPSGFSLSLSGILHLLPLPSHTQNSAPNQNSGVFMG